MQLILEETFNVTNEVILNEATGEKTYVIKGTFSTPDKKNRNGRVYATKLWEDNVASYQSEIANGTNNTLMEKEHPPRTAVDPWSAVAQIRMLEMRDGLVYGEAEVLNITETEGIRALIDRGVKIGVSSRGVGKMKGDIVEEFNLITYDIVATPSDYNANLQGFNESMILEGVEIESNGKGGWVCTPEGCTLSEAKTKQPTRQQMNIWVDDWITAGPVATKTAISKQYKGNEGIRIIDLVKTQAEEEMNEAKTPKWDVSKKEWIDADKGYIEAQKDIESELKSIRNKMDAKMWAEEEAPNRDFDIVDGSKVLVSMSEAQKTGVFMVGAQGSKKMATVFIKADSEEEAVAKATELSRKNGVTNWSALELSPKGVKRVKEFDKVTFEMNEDAEDFINEKDSDAVKGFFKYAVQIQGELKENKASYKQWQNLLNEADNILSGSKIYEDAETKTEEELQECACNTSAKALIEALNKLGNKADIEAKSLAESELQAKFDAYMTEKTETVYYAVSGGNIVDPETGEVANDGNGNLVDIKHIVKNPRYFSRYFHASQNDLDALVKGQGMKVKKANVDFTKGQAERDAAQKAKTAQLRKDIAAMADGSYVYESDKSDKSDELGKCDECGKEMKLNENSLCVECSKDKKSKKV